MYKKINSLLFDLSGKKGVKEIILFYILQLIVTFFIVLILSFFMGIAFGVTHPNVTLPTPIDRSVVTMWYLVFRYYPVCLSLYIIASKKRLYNFILIIFGLTPILLALIGGPLLSLIPPALLLAFSPSKKRFKK